MYRDFSTFYRNNERIEAEIRNLWETGALADLIAVLDETGTRLELTAWSGKVEQEELLGHLDPSKEAVWANEQWMAVRIETEVEFDDGERRKVYIPDHICPRCGNGNHNYVKRGQRACEAGALSW